MATKTVPTQSERQAQIRLEVDEANKRFMSFLRGAAKAITTDLPGFIADVADRLAGDTAYLGEKDRSEQMFSKATGSKKDTKTAGASTTENLGSFLNPASLLKAIIVPAFLTRTLGEVKAAKNMVAAGKDAEEIYRTTGIYGLPANVEDYALRSVISDAGLKVDRDLLVRKQDNTIGLVPGTVFQLDDVISHPELFNKMPDLRNVFIGDSPRAGLGGALYMPTEDMIGLGRYRSSLELEQALLHELQHGVQHRFGFARGSSPDKMLSNPGMFNRAYKAADDLVGKLNIDSMDPTLSKSQLRKVEQELEAAQVNAGVLRQAKLAALEQYRRVGGEAEARAVESIYKAAKESAPPKGSPLQYYDVPISELRAHDAQWRKVDDNDLIRLIIEDVMIRSQGTK